jgi:hypothetical protein
MSFREKSLWLMSMSLLAFAGLYFGTTLPASDVDVMPHEVIKFIAALILMVVTQVIGHVLIAIGDRRPNSDERDWLIELRGRRNGNHVLAAGVAISILAALSIKGNFLFTHLLLAFWICSQLVEYGSQIFLHRRGA